MKVLGFGIVAATLFLTAAPSLAADLIVEIPDEEAMAIANEWDGVYAGIGGIAYASPGSVGFGAVGNVGVNQTFGDNLLLGVEGYAGVLNSSVGGLFFIGGAEGRFGVLATDAVLFYGALGLEADSTGDIYGTLGGGVEFAVAENTTVDLEYKHYRGLNNGTVSNQIGVSLNFGF